VKFRRYTDIKATLDYIHENRSDLSKYVVGAWINGGKKSSFHSDADHSTHLCRSDVNSFRQNYSIATSLLGGILVFSAPSISRGLTKIRKGKMLPFQGILITFITLIITGGIIQLLV